MPVDINIHARHLEVDNTTLEELGGFFYTKIATTQGDQGTVVQSSVRHSLTQDSGGFRLPVAGLAEPTIARAAELGIQLNSIPRLDGLLAEDVVISDAIQNPSVVDFVAGNRQGVIRLGRRVRIRDLCVDATAGLPESRFVLVCENRQQRSVIVRHLRNSGIEALEVSRERPSTEILETETPRVILCPITYAADCEYQTSDVVIFLDVMDSLRDRGQLLLSPQDGGYSLFGIQKGMTSPPLSAADRLMAVFGPRTHDVPSTGRVRRDSNFAIVHHSLEPVSCTSDS